MVSSFRIAFLAVALCASGHTARTDDFFQPTWKKISRAEQDAIISIRIMHSEAVTCGLTFDRLKFVKIHEHTMRKVGKSDEDISSFRKAFLEAVESGKIVDPEPVADPARCTPANKALVVDLVNQMEAGVFPPF